MDEWCREWRRARDRQAFSYERDQKISTQDAQAVTGKADLCTPKAFPDLRCLCKMGLTFKNEAYLLWSPRPAPSLVASVSNSCTPCSLVSSRQAVWIIDTQSNLLGATPAAQRPHITIDRDLESLVVQKLSRCVAW